MSSGGHRGAQSSSRASLPYQVMALLSRLALLPSVGSQLGELLLLSPRTVATFSLSHPRTEAVNM